MSNDGLMHWDMRAVDTEFFETAPFRFVTAAEVRQPPERVFEVIATDPAGWGDWFPGFDHSGHWMTAGPQGVGSRRRVRAARATYDETIIAWEEPHRFAFRVDRASMPIGRALAEDYRITANSAGSLLQWKFAIHPRPTMRPLMKLGHPLLSRMFQKAARNLERKLSA